MSRKFVALLLIGLGTLLFLTNTGIIPNSFWPRLVSFWPLSFVILGIRLAFGQSTLAKSISFAVIILAVALAIFLTFKVPQNLPGINRIVPHNPREIYELDPFSEKPYRIYIR